MVKRVLRALLYAGIIGVMAWVVLIRVMKSCRVFFP